MDEDFKPANKNKIKPHIMESYAEDMVNVISHDTGGLVQKIIHEQEEREREKINYSPDSKQNRFFLFISLMFLFLACGLIGYYYFFYNQNQVVNSITAPKSLIINDNTSFVDISSLNKDQIISKIVEQKDITKIKKGQLEGLYFSENNKVIGFSRFNSLIKSNLLQGKVPIINDNFLVGIISFEIKDILTSINSNLEEDPLVKPELSDSGPLAVETYVEEIVDPLRYQPDKPTRKDLFVLLWVKSFADVFPVLNSWESKMFFDLHGLFGIDLQSDNNYLLTKDFEDGIVQNKNARILYDNGGKIVFMYVYADDNHVIIATTEESVKEVIERLVASKVRK